MRLPDEEFSFNEDWPTVTYEDIIAEGERMRREGLIQDIETVHGTVTIIRHKLLETS